MEKIEDLVARLQWAADDWSRLFAQEVLERLLLRGVVQRNQEVALNESLVYAVFKEDLLLGRQEARWDDMRREERWFVVDREAMELVTGETRVLDEALILHILEKSSYSCDSAFGRRMTAAGFLERGGTPDVGLLSCRDVAGFCSDVTLRRISH